MRECACMCMHVCMCAHVSMRVCMCMRACVNVCGWTIIVIIVVNYRQCAFDFYT